MFLQEGDHLMKNLSQTESAIKSNLEMGLPYNLLHEPGYNCE
jgi:hypothetical protein